MNGNGRASQMEGTACAKAWWKAKALPVHGTKRRQTGGAQRVTGWCCPLSWGREGQTALAGSGSVPSWRMHLTLSLPLGTPGPHV